MNQEQLNELGTLLREKAQALSEMIEQTSTDAQPVTLDQQSVGRVSRIDAIQQQQMAVASLAQAEQQLGMIERALARIEDGVYGDCLECGEAIAAARLQAQPWASLCIDCQSANETG